MKTIDLPGTIEGVVSKEVFDDAVALWMRCLMGQRSALLAQVDELERAMGIDPTTASMRRRFKELDRDSEA